MIAGTLALVTPHVLPAQDGKAVYDKWCAGCHGVDGKGKGPAATHMLPRPRDFTIGLYQIRSTPNGSLPTDDDLMHIIDQGMPGTAMPGWTNVLSQQEREQVRDYIKTFSQAFKNAKEAPKALSFGKAPGADEKRIANGKAQYEKIQCFKCHGQAGRGDGQSASTMKDDTDYPIRPADLTEPWYFNGGSTVEDIYRRLRTGVDGTPMPTFSDLIDAKQMTEADLWDVALYVRSLGPEKVPEVRDVVRASEVTGNLPSAPADSAWNAAEPFYIPLVGQIVLKPRWFAPTVDGVWVQALHNGRELAVRVTWNDPSSSPDPEWAEWQQLVTSVMEPKEDGSAPAAPAGAAAAGPIAAAQAPAAGAPAAPVGGQGFPDRLVLQFPPTIPTGMERPYFLMGTSGKPTYLWSWSSSAPDAPVEARGKGFGNIEPLSAGQLTGSAQFDKGQWRVVFKRPLASTDSANRLNFRAAVAIPMAVFAWDGNNGESGKRGSISTWYYIYLDQKTPNAVYATPLATIALTAGLGLLVVRNARRRKNGEV